MKPRSDAVRAEATKGVISSEIKRKVIFVND
jgi:hypothetical protein